MESSSPSLVSRVLAILVLVVIAVVAVRLAIGVVTGLITAVLWVVVLAALVAGGLWARRTWKGGRRERPVEARPAPALTHEDRVEAEMRKITEELQKRRG
jgi:hypothetical protein